MEFRVTFQIDKMTVFNVRYTTVGNNTYPYFATDAGRFVRSKRDYSTCGQCQKKVLPQNSAAMRFFEKWDEKHLHRLTEMEFAELMTDVNTLRETYNHIFRTADSFGNDGDGMPIRFWEVVELSKTEPKKVPKAA